MVHGLPPGHPGPTAAIGIHNYSSFRNTLKSDYPLEGELKQPDPVVGTSDVLVCFGYALDELFKRGFFLKCNHQDSVHTREAARTQVRVGTVTFSLNLFPPCVVVDAASIEHLHDSRGEHFVAYEEHDLHTDLLLNRWS
jgi:hypothetical protein